MDGVAADGREFGGEDDGHDDAVDGDDLAEDDGDQVLGPDAWRFNTAAEDGGAGDEDAPGVVSVLLPNAIHSSCLD